MKQIVIGILAHVDAGKTTLSENILYQAGVLRRQGRVDHGDAFLDDTKIERKRGITIFSKQATFQWGDVIFTLLDTPGHVDFSTEMERTLQVLDYAIIVINGSDGVQAHTKTIWKLLQHYQIPAFIFINKMDISYRDSEELLIQLRNELNPGCTAFETKNEAFYEQLAVCDEQLLEYYLQNDIVEDHMISTYIKDRTVIPCYFGSALKQQGVKDLMDDVATYTIEETYQEAFQAFVYKISRDDQGNRMTHVKITGGDLKVKTVIDQDKIDQIRLYQGNTYRLINHAIAGTLCTLKGPQKLQAGDEIDEQGKKMNRTPVLSSYMEYRLLSEGTDNQMIYRIMKELAEEDPQLKVRYEYNTKEIHVQFMGEMQIEVLQQILQDRYQLAVHFDKGSILYKETIEQATEGVGHFEPLRHYAEVHVLLEPLAEGSGIQYAANCPNDILEERWQQSILNAMKSKEHIGVLAGKPITDIKITLLTGKIHQKHTEGGDIRQATLRAIRQGLKTAKCILLEPYFHYQLEVPTEFISKAIFDLDMMKATYTIEKGIKDMTRIEGNAPVSAMQSYAIDVASYTKGKGSLTCVMQGYQPSQSQEMLVKEFDYHSEADVDNPTASVFCSHGSGFQVPWNEVRNYMHVDSGWGKVVAERTVDEYTFSSNAQEDILNEIFERTYGRRKAKKKDRSREHHIEKERRTSPSVNLPICMLIDAYNVIYDWPELSELAKDDMNAAREHLIHAVSSYQGYSNYVMIVVFDAYKQNAKKALLQQRDNLFIVYTKEAQTADSYIEKATKHYAKDYRVIVVTSDGLEQLVTLGQGAYRISSRQFRKELAAINRHYKEEIEQKQKKHRVYMLEDIREFETEDEDR